MRYVSTQQNGYTIYSVCGVNTVSFGVHAEPDVTHGLLGFAVERIDPAEGERYFMPGFKVFPSVLPNPVPDTIVSTFEHPVQSFVWDDFTAKPDHSYVYLFYPIKGIPKNLDRSSPPVEIRVRTEPLFTEGTHDVFFNRGVASSQAYERRFGKTRIADLPAATRDEAIQWLTRDLAEAVLRFIRQAAPGDLLLGCFYEFRYLPVAQELKTAIDRGVNVQLIIDGKVNEYTDKDGVFHESFPRVENLAMLVTAGIPQTNVTLRQAKPNVIQHNKFMVLVRGGTPEEVWTGSTNLSLGGFSGQTNVGHWVRDPDVATQFVAYWELLKTDPGATAGLTRSQSMALNRALQNNVTDLHSVPTNIEEITQGTTSIFSPRAGLQVLDLYVRLVDSATACSCITLAFGINKLFKEQLLDNTALSHIVFMLLEKRDRPNPRSTAPFVPLTAHHNVYQAWGAYIRDPVYRWARETSTGALGLNSHVQYVHSKFLLMDPLGADPILVTGSANFSEASTNDNDENMLLIRGEKRAADIYFTEFNRLFNHYYFRSVREALLESGHLPATDDSLFLFEADDWLKKYAPGTLRSKRMGLFTEMDGAITLQS